MTTLLVTLAEEIDQIESGLAELESGVTVLNESGIPNTGQQAESYRTRLAAIRDQMDHIQTKNIALQQELDELQEKTAGLLSRYREVVRKNQEYREREQLDADWDAAIDGSKTQ